MNLSLKLTTKAEDFQDKVFRTILKDNVPEVDADSLKKPKDVRLALLKSGIKLLWISTNGSRESIVQVKKNDDVISKYKVVCDITGITGLNFIGTFRLERIF